METAEDGSNLIQPHLVFKATQFVRGEDWTQKDLNGTLERDL